MAPNNPVRVDPLVQTAKTAGSTERSRRRFGISGKLQAAFGGVAALTIIATAVAFLSFSGVERALQQIAGHEVPVATEAMRLSVISAEISAAAGRFIGARTMEEQNLLSALISRRRQDLADMLKRIEAEKRDSPILAKLTALSHRLNANLSGLEEAISERNALRAQVRSLLDALHREHAVITARLSELPDSTEALKIGGRVHLLVSLISEGSILQEPLGFKSMQDRLNAAVQNLHQAAAIVHDAELKGAIEEIARYAGGADSVFARRARELFTTTRVDGTIDENAAIQREIDAAVATLVSDTQTGMQRATLVLTGDLERSRTTLLMVAGISLLAALAIGGLYVQRRLVRRLTGIGSAMRRLSGGDLTVSVPGVADRDEIGDMARSLEVFRAGELDRRRLLDRERQDQMTDRERASAMGRVIGEFRGAITEILQTVGENVSRIKSTVTALSATTHKADAQAHEVSAASAATSTSLHAVAAAANELGASIRQINRQTAEAQDIVRRAAETASSAHQLVGDLSNGADRIGDVVKLIRNVAQQTNLLALNATIEAARAGQFGRGFAVVAAEVKALATQTSLATEEIANQVEAIQSSTNNAITAIRSINEVMQDIGHFTQHIAGAVDVQNSSTQMIVTNVDEVATAAEALSGNMAVVTGAIEETSSSASTVLEASHALSVQADVLERRVEAFIKEVTAA